jgi:hypothetical protein
VQAEKLASLKVPGTLVGVLQARLDSLSADERGAIQQASIIGPIFWDAALAALDASAPPALPTLERKALVQPREPSAFEGTREEAFHHHLLHQVTYDTVLKAVRRGTREGRALPAARVGERATEYLGTTAEHYACWRACAGARGTMNARSSRRATAARAARSSTMHNARSRCPDSTTCVAATRSWSSSPTAPTN